MKLRIIEKALKCLCKSIKKIVRKKNKFKRNK